MKIQWQRQIPMPVWVPSHPDLRVSSILRIYHPDGEVAVPIFSTTEHGRACIERSPVPGNYVLREITQPLELLGLLVLLEERAVTHVVFDPGPATGEQFDFYSLQDFRAAVARAIE